MKTIRVVLVSAIVIIVGAIAAGIYVKWKSSPEVSRTRMEDAKITDISPMLQLCSVEMVEDVPIKAHIGSRHIFAKVTLVGNISFDLNDIQMSQTGDTLRVSLPKEIVEVMESTEPGSYQVIDTWNDRMLRSSHFTTAEENAIKAKVKSNYVNSIYRRGYVKRAREEAVENLTAMLRAATGQPVIVTDNLNTHTSPEERNSVGGMP